MGTLWHITFGTYGARLHGGMRSTVDRRHNRINSPTLGINLAREQFERSRMTSSPVSLSPEERIFIEREIPGISADFGWNHRVSAAQPDHVHSLIEAQSRVHGKAMRTLLKRALSQRLNETFEPKTQWWAEGGSTIAVKDRDYFVRVLAYIEPQRASSERSHSR